VIVNGDADRGLTFAHPEAAAFGSGPAAQRWISRQTLKTSVFNKPQPTGAHRRSGPTPRTDKRRERRLSAKDGF
jgi:hypothetical protein